MFNNSFSYSSKLITFFFKSLHHCMSKDPARRRWCDLLLGGQQGSYSIPGDAHLAVWPHHYRQGALPQKIHRGKTYFSGNICFLLYIRVVLNIAK